MEAEAGPLVISPFVVAELDYLVLERVGTRAELEMLSDVASGDWELAQFGAPDVRDARQLIQRYHDQGIGVTDASLVVLAERYRTNRILTLDRRHFSVLRTSKGEPLELLP